MFAVLLVALAVGTVHAQQVSLSIAVNVGDRTCQTLGDRALRGGEAVRFMIRNVGRESHELVIGTMSGMKERAGAVEQDASVERDESAWRTSSRKRISRSSGGSRGSESSTTAVTFRVSRDLA